MARDPLRDPDSTTDLEQVVGGNSKRSQADLLVALAVQSGAEFFHDAGFKTYATVEVDVTPRRTRSARRPSDSGSPEASTWS